MEIILAYVKKLIPKKLFKKLQPIYHYVFNFLAAVVYGFPSNKLIVVGVTGTTGKTTTTFMIAEMLKNAGVKVGYTSTAMFGDGETERLNDKKMTMLGRMFTQNMISRMVRNGCEVAIIETTSEGAVQFRHRFINYDMMVFTGIYPEHIESHGSFENYKKAKIEIFKHLKICGKKDLNLLNGSEEKIKKTSIIDGDDEFAGEFLEPWAEEKIVFRNVAEAVVCRHTTSGENSRVENFQPLQDNDVSFVNYKFREINNVGVKFDFDGEEIQMKILGDFNSKNATIAGAVGLALGLNKRQIRSGLEKVVGIPGRLERIDEGQDFTVIVDYAFEPVAVGKLYDMVGNLDHEKIIHVLGSAGGGRDMARREILGKLAGEKADFVIVTNEDPYDEDPMEIIKMVADGARNVGKVEDDNLFLIEDRGEAIEKAIGLAREGDVVLITGKGSEQAIVVGNGRKVMWDDRDVVREVLRKM